MSITISTNLSTIPATKLLNDSIQNLLNAEGFPNAEVSVFVTDDTYIHSLNLSYRGQDKPTDVLSFSQSDQPPKSHEAEDGPPILLGDVVISLDTAGAQALLHGVDLEHEIALLGVHGTLHLLGYEDETEEGALRMQQREADVLGISLR